MFFPSLIERLRTGSKLDSMKTFIRHTRNIQVLCRIVTSLPAALLAWTEHLLHLDSFMEPLNPKSILEHINITLLILVCME